MYDKEFAYIYDEYGWNEFSHKIGIAIIDFLASENILIKNHVDLACGVGELCNLFYNKSISTKGIDLSKDMINLAHKKYPEVPFEEKDIIKFKTKEKYNLVTCTCDAINHILKEKDLETLFRNVFSYLDENGYFVFDSINEKEILLNQVFKSERGKGVYVEYYLTNQEDVMNNNIKVYENKILIKEKNILEKIYTKEHIAELAEKIGFQIIKCDSRIMNEQYNTNNKIFWILKK